ncbi:MAG: hypothetical protein RIR18_636 [Pseudomonadota bacterium]|jgi:ribosome-associated protein
MKKAISKDDDYLDDDRPSKTQKKQAMLDLQDIGSRLVELSIGQAKSLNLPEDLLAAILDYHRFPKHEAQRRQLQYIGKIMRKVDPEPIEASLIALKGESAAEISRMHRLEDLRVRFLSNEKVIDEILGLWPQTDVSYMRQLRRNALKEQEQNKPPKSFRLIFKTFKALEKGDLPSEAMADDLEKSEDLD